MRCLKDGFLRHVGWVKSALVPRIFTSNQLINLYSQHGCLQDARRVFDEMPVRNVFTWNFMISSYVRYENLAEAHKLFRAACECDSVTYNALLSGYVSNDGYETDAVDLFMEMQKVDNESVRIDEFSVTTMLKLCAKLPNLCYGRQLHCFMVKSGNDRTGFAVSSLIDMYSKCGNLKDVFLVFDSCDGDTVDVVSKNTMLAACCRNGEMDLAAKLFWRDSELNDSVSWNTMISGYSQNGYDEEALRLSICMKQNGFKWSAHTFASVLCVLSSLKILKLGREVHCWVLKNDSCSNPFISSGIVDLYSKCGNMKYAELVHSAYGIGNSYSVSSMIVGYSYHGNMAEARKLFYTLSEKNPVVWTAMFSGYLKSQQYDSVFELLREFIATESAVPDSLIFIIVLGACSSQAALALGKQIHAYVLRKQVEMGQKLETALIDMYSKCGNVGYAENFFNRVDGRDSVIYNVMISGYAHHGDYLEAIRVFERMIDEGFEPDEITFLALLSACRHRGLLEEGEKHFKSMTEIYNVPPGVDHCACMIDLYGRANQLQKAVEIMKSVQVKEDDAVILGTFMNACRLNGNTELAKEAEDRLLRIEGHNGSRYVQLANVYASGGKWDEMGRIRRQMKGKEFKKFSGCSWLYIDGASHIFTSFDITHSRTGDIYTMLEFLNEEQCQTN